MRIGVLEDDVALHELYKLWFESAQHSCSFFTTVKAFTAGLSTETFDLLIIDWMLPDGSGDAVLKWVRANIGWEIPVIFVTARDAESDIVTALKAGADDYVVKPPKFLELLARIESLARRSKVAKAMHFGAYEIHEELRQIRLHGQIVELTQKELELALYLFQNHGKLLSREHLLEALWGLNANVDTRTLDTHVSRIRRKLHITPENGWHIVPVYGYGYRMERIDIPGPDKR